MTVTAEGWKRQKKKQINYTQIICTSGGSFHHFVGTSLHIFSGVRIHQYCLMKLKPDLQESFLDDPGDRNMSYGSVDRVDLEQDDLG